MKTYQDFLKEKERGNIIEFLKTAINEYRDTPAYRNALDADEYEAGRNVTITEYTKKLYTETGKEVPDITSSNNRIASNFFHRLTTQRCAYSLGNGVTFADDASGVKKKLGNDFDTVLYDTGHYALIHRVAYMFWNLDHADYFKMTEFCPLYDEYNGGLMAGIRFWSIDWQKKPVTVVLYEEDGYTKYRTKQGSTGMDIAEYEPKRAYKQNIAHNEVDPDEIISESNYSALPIVPFWGNRHHQSDLINMRSKIDAYDLVKSGFANDLMDCAEIYWIVGNAMGMENVDLRKFRDRIKLQHIAVVDEDHSSVTPYTQDIPVNARESLLKSLREQIYEDYGALDVHTVAAGDTNDHVEAAYQPMDEEADAFEYEAIKCIRGILNIIGVDAVPMFSRNRISNQKERTEMVMLAASVLDDETIIKHLDWVTPDEYDGIINNKLQESDDRFSGDAE